MEAAAKRYGIEIVPEFNSPGHSGAWADIAGTAVTGEINDTGTNPSINKYVFDTVSEAAQEKNAEWMANFIKSYRDWFETTDAVHLGGEEAWKQDWSTVTQYLNQLYKRLLYHADNNQNGFRRMQIWAQSDQPLQSNDPTRDVRKFEHMFWQGSLSTRASDLKASAAFYDIPGSNSYFVPTQFNWGSAEGIIPAEYYTVMRSRANTWSSTRILPDGLAIANWNDLTLQNIPWIGENHAAAGMAISVPAVGVVHWHGTFQRSSYGRTNYNQLIPASQELQTYWVRSRFPYMNAVQASLSFYSTSVLPTFFVNKKSGSAGKVFTVPKLRASLALNQGKENSKLISSHQDGRDHYGTKPGNRNTEWTLWDTADMAKVFQGPSEFASRMFHAQLVGEGNTLSDGRICLDMDSAVLDFFRERSTSACDEDLWENDISGNGGLQKSGPGKLGLRGMNSFRGNVALNGGELNIIMDENLGHTDSRLTFAGGTLSTSPTYEKIGPTIVSSFHADEHGNRIPFAGVYAAYEGPDYYGFPATTTISVLTVTIASGRRMLLRRTGGGAIKAGNEVEFGGVISGNGALGKSGTGKLILKGTNTFTGGLMLEEGVLEIGNDNNLGGTAGDLTFAGGTLAFAANADLASAREVVLDSDAVIDTSGRNVRIAGVVSGSADLIKTGTGELTLTGTNTYTGATRVSVGMLKGAATSLPAASNIHTRSGATVEISTAAGDRTHSGNWLGSGLIRKTGANALVLAGSSAPDWQIMAGKVESPGDFSGDITLASAGEFNFRKSGDLTYAGVVSGSGSLIKSGTGQLVLSGDSSSFAGDFAVKANTSLFVDGMLGGDVNVEASGLLGGSGKVLGDVMIASGAELNPSRSGGGQLQIGGNLVLNGDYRVAFGSGSIVDGSANIASGSVIVVNRIPPYTSSDKAKFNVLVATGGVTGKFAMTTTMLPFAAISISYTANTVLMSAGRNNRDLLELEGMTVDETVQPPPVVNPPPDDNDDNGGGDDMNGGDDTPAEPQLPVPPPLNTNNNRAAVAEIIQQAEASNDPEVAFLSNLIMNLADDPDLSAPGAMTAEQKMVQAADELSAEPHASAQSAAAAIDTGLYSEAAAQTRAAFDLPGTADTQENRFNLQSKQWGLLGVDVAGIVKRASPALWVKTQISKGVNEGDDSYNDMDYKGVNLLIGGDVSLGDNLRLGMFGGINRIDFSQTEGATAESEDRSRSAGIYSGVRYQDLLVRSGIAYSWHDIRSSRTAAGVPLSSSYRTRTYGAFGEVGYQFERGGVVIEPFLGVNYTRQKTGAFDEANSGRSLVFRMDEQSVLMGTAQLGVNAELEVPALSPSARVESRFNWSAPIKEPGATVRQRLGSSEGVEISGNGINGGGFTIAVGLQDFQLENDVSMEMSFNYSRLASAGSYEKYGLEARFTYKF